MASANSNIGAETFTSLVDRAIVLTGPTAAGKSAVALELAQRLDAEILSLDSIAVYLDMDIGTDKPKPSDRALVPHHLINLVDPTEDFSVARYLRAAHEKIDDLDRRGRLAIFVGGTPMFLKGILRGFDSGPPADWEFRRAVEDDVMKHGLESLRQRLTQVDPLAAHRIGPNDMRRMIRALEVAYQTGEPLSHRQTQFDRGHDAADCRVFALQHARDQLHRRINFRVDEMFKAGLIDEVRSLLAKYTELSRTASQAVGYREVIDWLNAVGGQENGAIDAGLDEMIASVAAHTRQMARRQETWLRSFSEVQSIPVNEPINVPEIADEIIKRLARSSPAAGQAR